MIKLAQILDDAKIPYLWLIFTDDINAIKNPNIVYLKPRLDIINYIANADYLVQLSDNEGYCYSVVEALTVGTPCIVTDCPVFTELGLENGKNGFILDFELSKVPVKEIYKGLPQFEYTPKESNWENFLVKGKSTYKKDKEEIVKVKCINDYFDMELNKGITRYDNPYEVTRVRGRLLEDFGVVKLLEVE